MKKTPTVKKTDKIANQVTKLAGQVTKLAEEETNATPKVKDPDLAEFIEVYGKEKGIDLYQSGADIEDVRTLKDLLEKYGAPGSDATALSEDIPADDIPAKEIW